MSVVADEAVYAVKLNRAFGAQMELRAKNDTLVYKIYFQYLKKKDDAHCKKYASNFRFSFTCL